MINLLPIEASALLNGRKAKLNLLNLVANIVNEALEACENFLSANYAKFDAQVGETSCHIRAYKICLLAVDENFNQSIHELVKNLTLYKKHVINCLIEFIDKLSTSNRYVKDLDSKEAVINLLIRMELNFVFNSNQQFIILAYFLNKYCLRDNEGIPNTIDYQLIRKMFNLSAASTSNLTKHYQASLSQLSCTFILEQLHLYHIQDGNKLFLQQLLKIGDQQRHVLPYYNSSQILVYSKDTAELPIMISIFLVNDNYKKKIVLLFKKNKNCDQFILQTDYAAYNSPKPCIIFSGIATYKLNQTTDYLTELLSYQVEEVVLLNAASHPQYSGENLHEYRVNPYKNITLTDNGLLQALKEMEIKLDYTQQLAQVEGFAQGNPEFFYVKHIFCDLINREASTGTLFNLSKI